MVEVSSGSGSPVAVLVVVESDSRGASTNCRSRRSRSPAPWPAARSPRALASPRRPGHKGSPTPSASTASRPCTLAEHDTFDSYAPARGRARRSSCRAPSRVAVVSPPAASAGTRFSPRRRASTSVRGELHRRRRRHPLRVTGSAGAAACSRRRTCTAHRAPHGRAPHVVAAQADPVRARRWSVLAGAHGRRRAAPRVRAQRRRRRAASRSRTRRSSSRAAAAQDRPRACARSRSSRASSAAPSAARAR